MDPTTAWEHPGFASSDPDGVALAAVKGDATLADLVLWDEATGDTIIRAYGPAGAVKFQTSAGAAGGIAWADVSKVGSSLLDLATRDASALNSGVLLSARLVGAYTGITTVGTLTSLTVSGVIDALNGINLAAGGAQGIVSWGGGGPYLRGAAGKSAGLYGGGANNGVTVGASGFTSLSHNLGVGTAVDSGYRIDVSGSGRVTGGLDVTGGVRTSRYTGVIALDATPTTVFSLSLPSSRPEGRRIGGTPSL